MLILLIPVHFSLLHLIHLTLVVVKKFRSVILKYPKLLLSISQVLSEHIYKSPSREFLSLKTI